MAEEKLSARLGKAFESKSFRKGIDAQKARLAKVQAGETDAGGMSAEELQKNIDFDESQIGRFTSQRGKDIQQGAAFGEELLGDGLGRLGTDPEVQETLGRFKDLSQGLGAAELAQTRSAAFQGIGQATQTSSRQLRSALARAGVKGGAAGSQIRDVELAGLKQKADTERDLFLKDRDARISGLRDFASAQQTTKTFDLAQAAREKDIIQQSAFGFAGLGASERGAELAAEAAERGAAAQSAAACFDPNTLVRMPNDRYMRIEDIRVGMETSHGTVLGQSVFRVKEQDLVCIGGAWMTKNHVIYDAEQETWLEAGHHTRACPRLSEDNEEVTFVYDLWTEGNRIEIWTQNGHVLCTDYEGMDISGYNDELLWRLNGQVPGLHEREVRDGGPGHA